MSINKLFDELFGNFLKINPEVLAVIISDQEGLIIAGEKSEDINMEIISVLTTKVNPILERIRNDASNSFGTIQCYGR